MGFNSVYTALVDVFPQVDTRMLKAVAIEHSKDAASAVEFILSEVLPHIPIWTVASIPHQSHIDLKIPETNYQGQNGCMKNVDEANKAYSKLVPIEAIDDETLLGKYATLLDEDIPSSSYSNFYDANDSLYQTQGNYETGDNNDLRICQTLDTEIEPQQKPKISSITFVEDNCQMVDAVIESEQTSHITSVSSVKDGCLVNVSPKDLHTNLLIQQSEFPFKRCSPEPLEHIDPEKGVDQFLHDNPSVHVDDTINNEEDSAGEVVDVDDVESLSTSVTKSGQLCRIYVLDDMIEDSKNNKKTLFSAVESVIDQMKEVELEENAAENAREEACRGGLDILSKVEDMKQIVHRSKEANDMHAGEVYGEKSILATEARELQVRLLSLSDEKNKSLAILDEMRQTLEVRLASAKVERLRAEHEKEKKEKCARAALSEQEHIMGKVVEESKILHQQAEENSKLQEFLMDRGHFVDILQGEICVICQDVKLLKQRFDECVPLSKSYSSNQTSCILASSSFLKSIISDPTTEKSLSPPNIISRSPSITSKSSIHGYEDDHKALLDDGWDLFDKDALC